MKILSLFDGISCGQQALKELGFHIDKYYSSEIDKYTIAITQYRFPNTIQLGNIKGWKKWNIDWKSIDLVMGGSPCQGFSFAGKQLNFNDPRSELFFVFVDILNNLKRLNPNIKFLLENVRMKKEYQNIISEMLGVKPMIINSALVSAQNRVRLYWFNWKVEQPKDRGILLKDVLENGENRIGAMKRADYKVKSMKGLTKQRIEIRNDNKSNTLTTVQKDNLCIQVGEANLKGYDSIKRVYSPEGKSPTLTTMGGGHREPKIAIREKSKTVRSGGLKSYDRHEWDSVGNRGTKLYWRKLTPLECERLQTLPDNYTAKGIMNGKIVDISNTRRYRALGNGWTVEVIKHILKEL